LLHQAHAADPTLPLAQLQSRLQTLAGEALTRRALDRVRFYSLLDLSELFAGNNPDLTTLIPAHWGSLREGRRQEALWLLNLAQQTNPRFDLAAATRSLEETLQQSTQDTAQTLIKQGNNRATTGQLEQAAQQYRYALQIDPSLDLNPDTQPQRVQAEAEAQAKQNAAVNLAQQGEITQALQQFQQLQQQAPDFAIDAESWNSLCWFGALHNQAASVLFACEKAVTLSDGDPNHRDSRGLARALTGDIPGAIADFQVFADSPDYSEEARSLRRQWITDLQSGQNPFTPQVLQDLLSE